MSSAALSPLDAHREQIADWFAGTLPHATDVTLSPFLAAPSGFSNVTVFTTATWSDAAGARCEELVLRAQPAGIGLFPDYDLRHQYDVMALLAGTPVPVPEMVCFNSDPAITGSPFFLMRRVDGVVASGFRPGFHGHGLFFDATVAERRHMWWGAVSAMAALHQLDPAERDLPASLAPAVTGAAAISRSIDRIEEHLDWAGLGPIPTLREAITFLRERIPSDPRTVVCWGDARPGNIIYRRGDVAAVLDWELAHLGPPEGDLAYFLLLDEVTADLNQVPRLAGLPTPAETIERYEQLSGRPVGDLDFHTALQALRTAAMLVLVVKLAPGNLSYPSDYLTNNIPTQKLAAMLRAHG